MGKQYNVDNVNVIITSPLGIFAIKCRHEDGFGASPSSEASSETVGSCGQKVTNVLPDGTVEIKIALLYGTEERKTMRALYAAWKASKGEFPMSVTVTDNNTKETYHYPGVSFKKRPDTNFANESGTEATTWELKAENEHYIPLP